jgi:hypothetical protein
MVERYLAGISGPEKMAAALSSPFHHIRIITRLFGALFKKW